jgi:SNF2 family DNA or RNA helicase
MRQFMRMLPRATAGRFELHKAAAILRRAPQTNCSGDGFQMEDSSASGTRSERNSVRLRGSGAFIVPEPEPEQEPATTSNIPADELVDKIDELFEQLQDDSFVANGEATAIDASAVMNHSLKPYQAQGVAWMRAREAAVAAGDSEADDSKQPLPAGWEEHTHPSGKVYVNPIFGDQVHGLALQRSRRPRVACGGILADDMGLGKTIQVGKLVNCLNNS